MIMEKRSFKEKLIVFLLLFVLLSSQASSTVLAAPTRAADVSRAGSGNVLAGVSGVYGYVGKGTILKRINEIRKEACVKGYPDPSTGRKLTREDYVPIRWSSDLEWIAQLRAAECTVNEDHTRPNGQSCFTARYEGVQSWGENLAWNFSGLMDGIEQWYSEKNDWVAGNRNAVTGHYTSMIRPENRYIGLGCFRRDTGGWYGVAAEFSASNSGTQEKSKLKGKRIQMIEVKKSSVKDLKLDAPSTIKIKKKKDLSVACSIVYPGIMGGTNTSKGILKKGITWKSSRPSVLSVSPTGKITAKRAGKARITAKVNGGLTVRKTIRVTR